jgi:hypothetical protein
LVEDLMPLLDAELRPSLDQHAADRYSRLRERYADVIARTRAQIDA